MVIGSIKLMCCGKNNRAIASVAGAKGVNMTDAPAHGDEPEDQLIRVLAKYWNEIQDLAAAEQRDGCGGWSRAPPGPTP
jgi:hypothetical protein